MKRPPITLAGAFVLVTGGSSGIGLATAKEFAERGASVAIVSRNPEKWGRALAEIRGCALASDTVLGEDWFAVGYECDLSDATASHDVCAQIVREHGVPDILVNSAGVIYPGEFVTMSHDTFTANVEHGFWTVVNPCRAIAPAMAQRGSGHIVNVSSVAGYLAIYGYTSYSASKYAVMGFTEALRGEMRLCGVGVSVVCPPDTETPALELEHTMRPPETDAIAGNIKPIAPEKVASAIVMAVEKNRYLVIPDTLSAFYFRLKGIWPELFYYIVDGDASKVRAKQRTSEQPE